MKPIIEHRWDLGLAEARDVQERLRHKVVIEDRLGTVRSIAGIDVGFEQDGSVTRAAVVVLDFPSLQIIEQVIARRATRFPYVPGFLSFREIPAVLEALGKLYTVPDLLMCDGQGIAHPRRLGIAAHLGVLFDMPAIGVAKSRLVGEHGELGLEKGAGTPLVHEGEEIGRVLRSRTAVRPLYVSPGHRLSIAAAAAWTFRCLTRYRLPEPVRWADRIASRRGVKPVAPS